jgi:hypothetical protein
MNYLVAILISIIVVFIFVIVLLLNTKTSNRISRAGSVLTIWYPLKKEVVDLEADLLSWNVQKVRPLWWGRFYSLNLEFKPGRWKNVYSRSLSGKVGQLIAYLEKHAPERKTQAI